jgi:8-oxo-dGTP pyrophosphatase MutT (NUDIX family)
MAAYGVFVVLLGPDASNPLGALGIPRKDNPNSFGLIGGHVEPGETEEGAIARECWEEAGIKVSGLKEVYRSFRADDKEVATFTATSYTGQPSPQEGEPPCKWCSFDELVAGRFGDYNKELFVKMSLLK